ncbi:ABC transporter [Gammaproteobacteria bacterium 42_54_T18]|nr:ABC transporter [Gammaproteobacteria bacterium 42_54_T18]
MSNTALSIQALHKSVELNQQTIKILTDINVHIGKGDSVAIVGSSGSGKSTLLGLMAGLDNASNGTISLMGNNLTEMSEDQRAKVRAEHVGFVFQSFQLLPNLSATENVMLPLEVLNQKNAQHSATSMLERVGLSHRLTHYPSQLSGGEQQRVALARAFVTQPDILFADEPTGNLDTKTGNHIADLLFELNSEVNTTLILVTHDEHLAKRCHHTIRLEAGALVNAS